MYMYAIGVQTLKISQVNFSFFVFNSWTSWSSEKNMLANAIDYLMLVVSPYIK